MSPIGVPGPVKGVLFYLGYTGYKMGTVTALDKKPLSFGEGTLGFFIMKPTQCPEL